MRTAQIYLIAHITLATSSLQDHQCQSTFTCGLLHTCCSLNQDCFSGCCSDSLEVCVEPQVCLETIEDYKAPQESMTPLVDYLQSQADEPTSPEDAVHGIQYLLKEKQCYTYAFAEDSEYFSVNEETRKVGVKSQDTSTGETTVSDWKQDPLYSYNEKKILNKVNIGKFAFGVDIPQGTDQANLSPTNYNYMVDPLNLRWKHVDEYFGRVNQAAIQTYDFKYYFYSDYYTYTADLVYQIDSRSKDWQEGTECYSYVHTKTAIIQKNIKCLQFAQRYDVEAKQVSGLIWGLLILGIGVGVFVFTGFEIRNLKLRNFRTDREIHTAKQIQVRKIAKLIVEQTVHQELFPQILPSAPLTLPIPEIKPDPVPELKLDPMSEVKPYSVPKEAWTETDDFNNREIQIHPEPIDDGKIDEVLTPRQPTDFLNTSDNWHYGELV